MSSNLTWTYMLDILGAYFLVRCISPFDLIHFVVVVVDGGNDFVFKELRIISLRILSSFILAFNTK